MAQISIRFNCWTRCRELHHDITALQPQSGNSDSLEPLGMSSRPKAQFRPATSFTKHCRHH